MPDDHRELVPPLPIPNRTVKRLLADDSAETSVKVGYRQALTTKKPQSNDWGFFTLCISRTNQKRHQVMVAFWCEHSFD